MNDVDDIFGRVPPTDKQRLYGEFVAGLPALLRSAGFGPESLAPTFNAIIRRFGCIDADAGNRMMDSAIKLNMLLLPPIRAVKDGDDAD